MLRYSIALGLLSPLVIAGTLYSLWQRGGGLRYLLQRFGFGYQGITTNSVWIHAASVGEVNAVLPLVKEILDKQPDLPILFTTNTSTGAKTVSSKLPATIKHVYLPLDFNFAVKRFLQLFQPRCALIVETELWLNLYRQCSNKDIPILLLNGRLSKKTLNCPAWLKPVLRRCLHYVHTILARNETDRENFIKLGAKTNNIEVTGNIKFARTNHSTENNINISRPYILAASTHEGEESLLFNIWPSLPLDRHILVLAPRYPERRDAVISAARAAKLKIAVRSHGDAIEEQTDVYLVDTLGELSQFITEAEIVFMGGSLVPRGGQNVLEPAHQGKAIITGPHTFTFDDEIGALLEAGAIIQVADAQELSEQLSTLLTNPKLALRLGNNANTFMQQQADVIDRYEQKIRSILSI